MVLVTCYESLLDMVVKESGSVVMQYCKETNYIIGKEDTSYVVLGLRKGLLIVHHKSHIGKLKALDKCISDPTQK